MIFADSGGTVAWGLSAKSGGTGQVSARADKGAGAQPSLWEARCQISLTGTNVAGSTIEYYVVHSDGTTVDAGLGTANAAVTNTEVRRVLTLIGTLNVYQTATNTTMYASFRNIYIPNRYFSLFMWNNTTLPTETSTTKHNCSMIPVPHQMQ